MKSLLLFCTFVVIIADTDIVKAAVLPFEVPFVPSDPNNPSSNGNKFLIAYLRNALPRYPDDDPEAYFVVSTEDNGTVAFQVNMMFGGVENTTTFTVTRDQPTRVAFNPDTVYVLSRADSDKVIWIQAEEGKKISVYVVNDEFRSTDGFVALPCDGMKVSGDYRRYKYLILSAEHDITGEEGATQRASQFLMITCEDDTRVTVTPSSDISGGADFVAGQPNVFGPDSAVNSANWGIDTNPLIPAKRVFMITKNADLTGTDIQSDKPLVVISGHECGHVPGDVTACDHMAVQIPPETTWGYTFLLNPLDARYSGDYYRFGVTTSIRQVTNTEVTITCVEEGGSTATVEYQETLTSTQRQNWDTFETHPGNCVPTIDDFSLKFCCLQATNPVVVTQYSYGHSADEACKRVGDRGDPFMSLIPPIVQYKRFYNLVPITLTAGPIVDRHVGVSVYVDYFQPSRIMLDDAPFEAIASLWQTIYCPREPSQICGYVITKVLDENTHILYHADEGAAIFVHSYAFLNENSYGLSGGMELQSIADCEDNSVRLVGGNDIAGRVEVCYNNVWGTVCDDSWDVSDARVICTQLGIPSQSPVVLRNAAFGEGDGPIWLDDLRCNGNESSLQFCPHMGVGESNCDHDEDAGVVCTGDSAVICPPLPDIPNGNVTRTALVVTYTCNSGFVLNGSLIRICGNDGTWRGDEPSCQLAPVSVSFDPTAYTVTEGVDATAELMLVRSGDLNREVVVSVSTRPGTAIAGDDFTSVAMMVTFGAGQSRASVSVPIIDDILIEMTEVFTGSLSAVTESVVIGADTADVTIIENDRVMCPTLPGIPNGGVSWTGLDPDDIATYTCDPGYVLDRLPTRVCGGDGTWSGDEPSCRLAPVSVSFDPTAYTVTEGVDATAELMLVRSGDNREVVVSVSTMSGTAIAGNDFTSVAMMVTFSAGQSRASVSVPIIDDILGEISEVFTGSLKAVTGNVVIGADTADVTIINDDNTGDTSDKSSPSDNTAAIIGGVASVVIAIIIVVFATILVVVLFYCNKTRKRDTHLGSLDDDTESNSEHEYFTLKQNTTLLQQLQQPLKNKNMIYSKEKLQLSTTVGQGESGLVYKAYLNTALGKELVAVKTVKALFSSSDTERLGKEISTMLLFEHTNIMSLIGVCIEGEMPLLIMPFMSNGSVLEYVKRNKEVLLCSNAMATEETSKTLLGIFHQIAKGMEYLAQEKFVHRDLAARNCMIDRKGVIKVADFGLTEDMYGTNYFRRRASVTGSEEKVPIRWMAPESMKHDIYNEETDVWAFGVTMWEIYTCGRTPYTGIPAMSLLRALEDGQRLEKPDNTACHNEIYDMMMECWAWNHHERPRFKELVNRLSDILERDSGYLELSQPFSLKTKSDGLDKHDPPVKENEESHL